MRLGGFDFSDAPDWQALIASWSRGALLHVDMPFCGVMAACRGRLGYLATPYSKEVLRDGLWCPARSAEMDAKAARWVQRFAVDGVTVVSPISLACGAITADPERYLDPLDGDFWGAWCAPILRNSDCVIVPGIAGWQRSAGIWHEVCFALGHNVPVYLIEIGSEFALPKWRGAA